MKELLEKFADIDSNRDGLVDLNEFAEYLNLPVTRHIRHLFSLYDRVSSLWKICDSNWLQTLKELWNLVIGKILGSCDIWQEIGFQKLHNFWVAEALISHVFVKILSLIFKPASRKKHPVTLGLDSVTQLIVLWSFNIQNWCFFSLNRNWIAYANEVSRKCIDFT